MPSYRSAHIDTTGRVEMPGLFIESPADRFVEAMMEAHGEDRAILAIRAIRHDPGCIEARLALADVSGDVTTRMRHLDIAVETGEHLWGPVARKLGSQMTWWGFPGTRPYMRALAALGQAHLDAGSIFQAVACFDRLLAMNPNDNQGVRYLKQEIASASPTARAP